MMGELRQESLFAEENNVIFSANPPAFTAPFTMPFPTTSAPRQSKAYLKG
jgi:hypothetical protein